MKKFLSFVLTLILLTGFMPCVTAGGNNLLQNGSFELYNGDTPGFWGFQGGEAGKEFTLVDVAADGKKALKLHSESGKSIFAYCAVRDLIPGSAYKVTGKVMLPEGALGLGIKAEYIDADNKDCGGQDYKFDTLLRQKRWQKVALTVNLPTEAPHFRLLLRSLNGSEIWFDDFRVEGKVVPAVQTCEFVETLPDAPNLIENGDFEETADGGAIGWEAHGKTWDGLATLVKEEDHGNVLRLFDYGSQNPWGRQIIKNMEEGATYQVTAELKTITVGGSVRFKTEYYSGNTQSSDTFITQANMPAYVPTRGEWQKVAFTFTMPVGTNCLALYARMYGAGEAYYDNIEMRMVEKAPYIHVGSDAFVYSEWETAEAYADFNDVVYEKEEGSSMTFTLLDGDTVLDSAVTKEDYAVYPIDVSLLKEKKKKYIVRVSYVGADGKVIASYDEPIYKYDRPSRLTEDGRFITADGEKILMSFGYHASSDHYADAAEIGINAIQVNAAGSMEGTQKRLDALWENGIYAFLELYGGMKPSGHPDNIDHTIEVVNTFKDHPAVMGYMIMDEPFVNDPNGYEDLRTSYKLFRDLDPEKPVYMVECERKWLYKTITVCDIFAIDPYPTGSRPFQTHVSDFSRTADIVNVHNKPIMNILQAYELGGWEPTPQEMRHMAYQAFFVNNHSIGYYPLSDTGGLLYDNAKKKTGFLYEGVKFFMQEEYEDAFNAFVTEEYATFSELSDDRHPVWHKAYIKDGELYIVLLNRTKQEQSVQIPLTSGGVSIGTFRAEGKDLLPREEITGNGVFSVTLAPVDVVRYKLQTDEKPDAALLQVSAFSDTQDYVWAEKEINRMSSLGITNVTSGAYRPGVGITRGEFAMFLVRTLGLANGEEGEPFADVDPKAAYAAELAIGRAAGILNGIGDNMYNPEAPITRQEMMTIIARGMQLAGRAELSVFSDSDSIADWAVDGVSAMVGSGLILGNADGTINPLGNTTRAEAAVIMGRILDRVEAAEVKRSEYAVNWQVREQQYEKK